MSILKKLFGGGGAAASAPDPETYDGFTIFPEPASEGGRYRIGARIEKEIGGELKSHILIRADVLDDHQSAVTASLNKAKQVIDEQGDRLFG